MISKYHTRKCKKATLTLLYPKIQHNFSNALRLTLKTDITFIQKIDSSNLNLLNLRSIIIHMK